MHVLTRLLLVTLTLACFLYMFYDEVMACVRTLSDTNPSLCESVKYIQLDPQRKIAVNAYEHYIASTALYTPSFEEGNAEGTIFGHAHVMDEIDAITNMWYQPQDSALVEPPLGILLYGPPGTGKTTLSRQLCKRLNTNRPSSIREHTPASFLHVSSDMIENKYQGEGLKLMRAVFTLCAKIQPCVLFIDEVDGIMSKRSDMDQSHVNNMKTVLLSSMDQLRNAHSKVLIVAATNRPECIDPALMRRLELHFHMNAPTLEDKCDMLVQWLGGDQSTYREWIDTLFPPSFTLHDIQAFLRFCARKHLRNHPNLSNVQWDAHTLHTLYDEYITVYKFVKS